jgi:hypothetical protein
MTNHQKTKALARSIFRATYGATPFRSVGRAGLAWAWQEASRRELEARRLAAIPADVKAATVAALSRELETLTYREDYRTAQHRRKEIATELAALAA